MRRLIVTVAIAGAAVFGPGRAPALAEEAPAPSGLYIAVRPSIGILEDLDLGASELRTTGGFGMSGAVGYRFSRVFRADVELAFRSHAMDELRPPGGPDLAVDGTVSAGAILANVYVDIPTGSRFTPYVGGGAGVGYVAIESEDDALVGDESDAVFAYQAAAGLQIRFTPIVSVLGGYRFFATSDPDLGQRTRYRSHHVDLGLRFDF